MRWNVRQRKRNGKKDQHYTLFYSRRPGENWKQKSLHTTNERVAKRKAAEIIEQKELEQAGLVLPKKLTDTAATPLAELAEQYCKHLKGKGRSRQYVWDMGNRLARLRVECGWEYLRDVTAESFEDWRDSGPLCVNGKRAGQVMAPKTQNDYRDAAYALCAWLMKRRRTQVNPIEFVEKLDVEATFERAAYTPEQARQLLEANPHRAVLYLTALYTSYRRGTLYRLTWGCVDLDGERPEIRPAVETIKNRDEHRQPLTGDLLAVLKDLRPDTWKPGDRVFAGMLPCTTTVEFLHEDLARAGLPTHDEDGRVFDFHAFRHTACTWAAATGATGAVFRAFTGHKTEAAAAKYLRMDRMPVQTVTEAMPDVWPDIGPTDLRTNAEKPGQGRKNADAESALRARESTKKAASLGREAALAGMTPTGFEPVLPG